MEEPETPPDEESAEEEPEEESPPPRKKKRRKPSKKKRAVRAAKDDQSSAKAESPEEPEEPEDEPQILPGEGTTEGDRLREAHRFFEVGDYLRVRRHCDQLISSAEDPAVVDAARNLRRRVEIDPIQIVVLSACAAALFAIIYTWVL